MKERNCSTESTYSTDKHLHGGDDYKYGQNIPITLVYGKGAECEDAWKESAQRAIVRVIHAHLKGQKTIG